MVPRESDAVSGSKDDHKKPYFRGMEAELMDGDSDDSDSLYTSNPGPSLRPIPSRRYRETHSKYNNRWDNRKKQSKYRAKGSRDYAMSVLSDDTEDSWDARVNYNPRYGENDIMLTHKKIVSLHRQKCYRREQSAYVAELKAAGKVLAFPKFGQLPAELRLRIWEMHYPNMLRSQRVLQLVLLSDGHVHMDRTMSLYMNSTRRFMRICQETRALGERYMPDTLRLRDSSDAKRDSFLRYNSQRDILHFTEETTWSLSNVKKLLDSKKALDGSVENTRSIKIDRSAIHIASPHTSVHNIAIFDYERRTPEPGIYHNRHVTQRSRFDDASHREPKELLSYGWSDEMDYLFPNVENIYVLEYGGPRKSDRWIGHDRSYERHHIRTIGERDTWGVKMPYECLYCWHGPPKGFRGRQALPMDSKVAPAGDDMKEVDESSPVKDKAEADDGDFKDGCIINHFANLRNKGVRFSRMLYFVRKYGMEDYYRLRSLTCPNGTWPDKEWPNNDNDDRLQQDEPLMVFQDSEYFPDENYAESSECESLSVYDDDDSRDFYTDEYGDSDEDEDDE